jgi:hypothetical protein
MKTRCQAEFSRRGGGWIGRNCSAWRESRCVVISRPFGVGLAPHFVTERPAPHGFLGSRPTGSTGSQAPSWTRRGARERMLDERETSRRFRREAKPARDGLGERTFFNAET